MKCQTCIHRYVCKYLFIFSEKDFERCRDYRLDESTVSKRRFANVRKTHHIAEVGKKVKSVYPVKSERLCEKCIYTETKIEGKNYRLFFDNGRLFCFDYIESGQPCKYFKRKPSHIESLIRDFYSEKIINTNPWAKEDKNCKS